MINDLTAILLHAEGLTERLQQSIDNYNNTKNVKERN